ncbi:MAG: tetratricopeptide repeat protein [Gammaproteobacteria bacterium]
MANPAEQYVADSFPMLLRQAKQHHLAGHLHEAEIQYRRLQDEQPDNFEVVHWRGVLNAQLERYDLAHELLLKAVTIREDHAGAHSNLGNVLAQLGALQEAGEHYRHALALAPDAADCLSNLANLLLEQGNNGEAEALLLRAIEIDPQQADACSNLGNVLRRNERLLEAEQAYRRALAINPRHLNALLNCATLLQELDRPAEAEPLLRQALLVDPGRADGYTCLAQILAEQGKQAEAETVLHDAAQLTGNHVEAYFALSNVHWEAGQPQRAEQCLRQLLQLQPDHADAHCNLGAVLRELGNDREAERHLREAIAINPEHADAYCNLGNLCMDRDDYGRAIKELKQAIGIDPGHVNSYSNLGVAYWETGDLYRAEKYFYEAIALDPDHVDAHSNLGMVLLTQGEFRQGWQEYEWRFRRKENKKDLRHYQQPLWRGQPLRGKTLFVYPEQGLGDIIQFSRYLLLLNEAGAGLVFEAPPRLHWLCARLNNAMWLSLPGEAPGDFDFHVPLLSIPAVVGTEIDTIPVLTPYLQAMPEKVEEWRRRLDHVSGLKVGLVWQGNSAHKRDRKRSFPLTVYTPLFDISGIQFVSLQKGEGEEQIKQSGFENRVLVFDGIMDNGDDAFIDTTAIIANLDLIITCDTAIAHLAGAMDKPVWLLLPNIPDFRWMLGREQSPWYPSMRLFRQVKAGDWAPVIEEVKHVLESRVMNHEP